jgi:hypothetical protein
VGCIISTLTETRSKAFAFTGWALLVLACLLCVSCATQAVDDSGEAVALGNEAMLASEDDEAEVADVADVTEEEAVAQAEDSKEEEAEVSLAIAESEPTLPSGPDHELAEVLVMPARHDVIHNHVAEAQALLRDIDLKYFFTGKGKKETLRGRPVAFALWSELKQEWIVANVEIPRPPIKWKPGKKPLPFTNLTPGITATHVKGTGAERLMFAFSRNGEPLKVYGRKFPVFDDKLIKKKQWRAVAQTARPIVYLPFTEDTFDPLFVTGGKDYLMATARRALDELRMAGAPSKAFPGKSLADVVPAEVITTLAVIEQTDDGDFVRKGEEAFNEVLSQYGLKRGEAYRYSVSSASAIGPMQFTNRRGNGTYALTVRRCPEARLDRDFERGATNLLNAMKAAICLFDIELLQMADEISDAYRDNQHVLGIFPVAAYNGGPKNVKKLAKSIKKMNVKLSELRPPGEMPEGTSIACPCLWKETADDVIPVPIPRYNNENRWYIEKYQRILSVFEEVAAAPSTPS